MSDDPWAAPFDASFGPGAASPNGTVIKAGSTATITDASGHVWTLAKPVTTASVAVNGDVEASSKGIVEMAFVNGEIWIQSSAGLWQGKSTPAGPWLPIGGTSKSPL